MIFPGEEEAKKRLAHKTIYQSALSTRYASEEMLYNFSELKKFSTWRKLWYNLATAEKV